MSQAKRTRWCLLVHALPARPLYLRARVRRLLSEAGAAPLKKAVYVMPWSDAAMAALGRIVAEIEAAGASAFLCEATFPDEAAERAVLAAFNEERAREYREWIAVARGPARSGKSLPRLRQWLAAIRDRDRFGATGSAEAKTLMAEIDRHASPRAGRSRADAAGLAGHRWVTRKGLHVDRLACAWVVRRFVDPAARFRFVASPEEPRRPGEIGFDMPGAEITHEDGRCSVEALVRRARIADAHVRRITEMVHDVDLKDGRYGHAETAGFESLLTGTILAHADDETRLARGLELFDALYASLAGGRTLAPGASAPPRVRIPATLRRRGR